MNDRPTNEGRAHTYCHMGKIGVVLELRCETDFCSRSGEFLAWCEDLAMQVAATNPASVEELLAQPFVKDESKTVADHLQALRSMVGERLVVAGFARREVGAPSSEQEPT